MPKGWRSWTVVLRALKRIGVDEYDQDDGYVYVTRFPHAGQAIRKWYLPKEVEDHLIQQLRLDIIDYRNAIRAVEAEDRGERSSQATPPPDPYPSIHALGLTACLARVQTLVEDGARGGDTDLNIHVDESFNMTAMVRAAKDCRDDLHLALEQQIQAVMRQYPSLLTVRLTLPAIDPFLIGRPGYDD